MKFQTEDSSGRIGLSCFDMTTHCDQNAGMAELVYASALGADPVKGCEFESRSQHPHHKKELTPL
jgi:hypothetical protein